MAANAARKGKKGRNSRTPVYLGALGRQLNPIVNRAPIRTRQA